MEHRRALEHDMRHDEQKDGEGAEHQRAVHVLGHVQQPQQRVCAPQQRLQRATRNWSSFSIAHLNCVKKPTPIPTEPVQSA